MVSSVDTDAIRAWGDSVSPVKHGPKGMPGRVATSVDEEIRANQERVIHEITSFLAFEIHEEDLRSEEFTNAKKRTIYDVRDRFRALVAKYKRIKYFWQTESLKLRETEHDLRETKSALQRVESAFTEAKGEVANLTAKLETAVANARVAESAFESILDIAGSVSAFAEEGLVALDWVGREDEDL